MFGELEMHRRIIFYTTVITPAAHAQRVNNSDEPLICKFGEFQVLIRPLGNPTVQLCVDTGVCCEYVQI